MTEPSRPGMMRRNIDYARMRYREGGWRLVMRRGFAKLGRGFSTPQPLALPPATASREEFDACWYVRFYGLTSHDDDMAWSHFTSIGSQHGLSPSASWHEQSADPTCPLHNATADLIREDFDPDWYTTTYSDVAYRCEWGSSVSPLWHYFTEGAGSGKSPNEWFDEEWYLRTYRDVAHAKAQGNVVAGFVHYLHFGRDEQRSPNGDARPSTSEIFDQLSNPVAFSRLDALERTLKPFPFRVYPASGTRRINFLVPTLDKNIMFGGYIAALNFMKTLLDRGWHVRLLITEDATDTRDKLLRQFEGDQVGASVIERSDLVVLSGRSTTLDISTDDRFVAYSMWAAHHAHLFAHAVGRRFIFFIQEYEPTFHHHDAWHATGAAVYDTPHFALFNDPLLRRYFRTEKIGVFSRSDDEGMSNSTVFRHALSVSVTPTADELDRGPERRLLVYARPEAHASRNLFEIVVSGLRRAVGEGILDHNWTFDGIGSLKTTATIPLGRGHILTLRPRLPLGDYGSALRQHDVGLSLQYAPHPGVVHFEMAASGMTVVTNSFRNRSAADLRDISTNLIGIPPTTEGVAQGLRTAVERVDDIDARVEGASSSWVTDWKDSFNDEVMTLVERELR